MEKIKALTFCDNGKKHTNASVVYRMDDGNYRKQGEYRLMKNEYDCLAKLKNYNIVPNIISFDLNENNSISHIDITKIDGVSCEEFFKKNISKEDVYAVINGVVRIMKMMVDNNIVHRDIRPDNLLYDKTNKKLNLIDFGWGCEISKRDTEYGCHTPVGEEYRNKKSFNDFYSFGAILKHYFGDDKDMMLFANDLLKTDYNNCNIFFKKYCQQKIHVIHWFVSKRNTATCTNVELYHMKLLRKFASNCDFDKTIVCMAYDNLQADIIKFLEDAFRKETNIKNQIEFKHLKNDRKSGEFETYSEYVLKPIQNNENKIVLYTHFKGTGQSLKHDDKWCYMIGEHAWTYHMYYTLFNNFDYIISELINGKITYGLEANKYIIRNMYVDGIHVQEKIDGDIFNNYKKQFNNLRTKKDHTFYPGSYQFVDCGNAHRYLSQYGLNKIYDLSKKFTFKLTHICEYLLNSLVDLKHTGVIPGEICRNFKNDVIDSYVKDVENYNLFKFTNRAELNRKLDGNFFSSVSNGITFNYRRTNSDNKKIEDRKTIVIDNNSVINSVPIKKVHNTNVFSTNLAKKNIARTGRRRIECGLHLLII